MTLDTESLFLFSGSTINGGAMIGNFATGPFLVALGQRVTLLILLPIILLSWVVLGLISRVWLIITVRFFMGTIIGVCMDSCTSYIVEISHKNLRGKLVALMDTARQIGFLYVYTIGGMGLTWRETAFVCGTSTTIIPFISLLFVPSSPRWLSTKHRFDDARRSLKFFRGSEYNYEDELGDIKAQLEEISGTGNILGQARLLCQKNNFLRVILVSTLLFLFQFNGNPTLVTYSVVLLKSANTGINENLVIIILGGLRVAGSLFFLLIAEQFPRKVILILNIVIATVSIGIIGVYFYLQDLNIELSSVRWIIILFFGIASFTNAQMQPLISMLRNELLPNSIRAFSIGLCVVSFCLGGFLSGFFYPMMATTIGIYTTFWIYSICGLLSMIIVICFVPETKGKSLEEINAEVTSKKR